MNRNQLEHNLNSLLKVHGSKIASKITEESRRLGLTVTSLDGSTKDIPVSATVKIIEQSELEVTRLQSQQLSEISLKISQNIFNLPKLTDCLTSGLSPKEQHFAKLNGKSLTQLATTRVDYIGEGKHRRALELNATIPAMQGYSDIAVQSFLKGIGSHLNLNISELDEMILKNGENAKALLLSLLQGYQEWSNKPHPFPRNIAILCRKNDSQLGELRYLEKKFSQWGVETHVIHPSDLEKSRDNHQIIAKGIRFDMVYRHLFVRRLEELNPEEEYLLTNLFEKSITGEVLILNPPSSQIEVKSLFALLSESMENSTLSKQLNLSDNDLMMLTEIIPWTRIFSGDNVFKKVISAPEEFVLKRSWDYGGRAVFIGKEEHLPSFQDRARQIWPHMKNPNWQTVCEMAINDDRSGGFIVQRAIPISSEKHMFCIGNEIQELDVYVDFSMYGTAGIHQSIPWQGVCRASVSTIVNIMGGGGLVPVLQYEVAKKLYEKLKVV